MSGFYGQVYQVVEKRNFDKDVSFDKNLTVNENASVKQDLEVGKNLTVNENVNVKQDLQVDKNLTINENANVKQGLQVDKNLIVNENVSVKQGLQVGENILIQGNQISIKGSLGEEFGTYDSLVFLKDNDEVVASIAVNNAGTLVFDLPLKNSDYFERYRFIEPATDLTENKEYYILTSKNVTDNWLSILKEEDGVKLSFTEEGYLAATGFKVTGGPTITDTGISAEAIYTPDLQILGSARILFPSTTEEQLKFVITGLHSSTIYSLDTLLSKEAITEGVSEKAFKILTNYNFKENTLLWVDSMGFFSANQSEPDSSSHFFNGKGLMLGALPDDFQSGNTVFDIDLFSGLYVKGPITQTDGEVSLSGSSVNIGGLLSTTKVSLISNGTISLYCNTGLTLSSHYSDITLSTSGSLNNQKISLNSKYIVINGITVLEDGSAYGTDDVIDLPLDTEGQLYFQIT